MLVDINCWLNKKKIKLEKSTKQFEKKKLRTNTYLFINSVSRYQRHRVEWNAGAVAPPKKNEKLC